MKKGNACTRIRGQICAHRISMSAKWDSVWHPNGQNAFICGKKNEASSRCGNIASSQRNASQSDLQPGIVIFLWYLERIINRRKSPFCDYITICFLDRNGISSDKLLRNRYLHLWQQRTKWIIKNATLLIFINPHLICSLLKPRRECQCDVPPGGLEG